MKLCRPSLLFFVLSVGLLVLSPAVHAATVYWNVDASGNWNTPGNWTGGSGVPAAGDDVVLLDPTPGSPAGITITLDGATANLNALTVQDSNIIFAQGANNVQSSSATITAGTWTQGTGTITISGSFANNGGTFTGGSGSISIGGTFTNAASRTFTSTSGTLIISGDFTNNGTFTHNSGTLELDGTGAQAFNPGSSSFNNVTVSNTGTTSLDTNSLTLAGNLSVTGGMLSAGTLNLTVNGNASVSSGATLSASTGKLTLGDVSGDTIANAGTLEITGAAPGELKVNGTLTNTGTIQATNTGILDFNAGVDSSGATLSFANGATVSFAGDLTLSAGSTFTHNGQDITFDGTTNLTSGGHTFPGITVNSTLTLSDALTLGSGENLTVNGTVTTGGHDLVVPGNLTGTGELNASGQGANSEVTVGGDFNVTTFQRSTTSTLGLLFDDAGNDNAQSFTTNNQTFGAITVNDATGTGLVVTVTGVLNATSINLIDGNLHLSGNNLTVTTLTLTGGELRITAAALQVTGTTTLAGGELSTSGAATLNFDGAFSATAASTLDLSTSTLIYIGGDFNLTSVTLQIGGVGGNLHQLTSTPAIFFDGDTSPLIPKSDTTWPHTRIDGTVTQSTYDMEIGTSGTPKNLTFNGGTLTVSVGLIVHGTTTLSSTLTFSGGTSTLHGLLTVGAGDTVNFQGGTVNILGGISNSGATFTATGGTVNLDATQSITANTTDVILPTTVIDSTGSGAYTITVSGDHALQLGNLSFGAGGTDKITTTTTEVHFTGTVNGTNGELEATGAATFHFDGAFSASAPSQFDLNAAATLRVGGDFNLTNVTIGGAGVTSLVDLTANPAVIFDGTTTLTSAGNVWSHMQLDSTQAGTDLTPADDLTIGSQTTSRSLSIAEGELAIGTHTLQVNGTSTIGTESLTTPPVPGNRATDSILSLTTGALDFNGDVTAGLDGKLTSTGGTINFQDRYISQGYTVIPAATTVTAETSQTVGNSDPWRMIDGTLGTFVVTPGIELDIEATNAGYTITIPGGATVNSATLRLADEGNLTIQTELNFNSRSVVENIGTGTLTIEPDLTIIPGAQFLNTGGGKIVFAHVFNDSTINFSNSTGITFQKLTNKGILFLVNSVEVEGKLINVGTIYIGDGATGGTLQVGELDMEGEQPTKGLGTLIMSDRTDNLLIVEGDIHITGTFDPGQGTVRLTGTGVLSDKSNTFYNLEITGGTRTLETDLHVLNNLYVGNASAAAVTVKASILDCVGYDVLVEGTTYIASTTPASGPATAIMKASGGTHTLSAVNIGGSGTYNNDTAAVTIHAGGTWTNAGITILGSGPVSIQAITNSGQFTATPGELSIDRNGGINNTGVFNANVGTLVFMDLGTFTPGSSTYHNLVKRGLGTTTTLAGDLTLDGTLAVESGTLSAGANDITVAGDVSVQGNSLSFTTGDLILNPPASATQTFDSGTPSSTYNDLIKRGDGTSQLISHPLELTTSGADTGDLFVESGIFDMDMQAVTVPGTLTVNDTATLTDNTGKLRVTDATTINGTFNTTGAATHRFTGAVTVNVDGFYSNGTNSVTVHMAGVLTNNGNITLGSGEVEVNKNLTNTNILTSTSGNLKIVGANFDNSNAAAVYNHNGGALVFGGTGTFTPGISTYNNITKVGANTTTTLSGNLTSAGTLSVEGGTFALGANTVSVGSLTLGPDTDGFSGNGLLTVAGDFTNSMNHGGNYSHSGVLSLTGTGTFTPGTSNYDGNLFTSGTMTLAASSTLNFAGAVWTNRGSFTAGADSTVKFVRSGAANPQTLTTGGAPNVPAMAFANIETDNDGTITFATEINLTGKFTIAGDAAVRDVTPGSLYTFAAGSEVNVGGTWTVTGSPYAPVNLLGPVTADGNGDGIPDDDATQRWRLVVNSSGRVNLNYANLLSSELVTHGGSINGKNVGYTVESFGNLSPSWGPFDPVPIPSELLARLSESEGEDTGETFPGDANEDGWVNLTDFSILAATFGGSDDRRADFNGDGWVSLADFSILAANFGKSAGLAAPAVVGGQSSVVSGQWSVSGETVMVTLKADSYPLKAYAFQLDYDHVALELLEVAEGNALSDTLFMLREDGRVFSASRTGAGTGLLATLRFRVTGTPTVTLRDVQVVDAQGNLLHLPDVSVNLQPSTFNLQPERTRLLANYPNPFNPETWIPFELASDADVRLGIFDVSGRLVRTLELGHLSAGRYVDSSSAAYWDGRNNAGERVASGTYFYRIHAGEFTAMRRMVILR